MTSDIVFEDLIPTANQNIGFEDLVAQAPRQQLGPGTVVDIGAPIAEGFTFGFAPKIAAAMGAPFARGALGVREAVTGEPSPTLGELYRSGVDIYRGVGERSRRDMPVLSTVGEIGGAIGGGLGVSGTKGAQALGRLAGRLGTAGRVGAGALSGEAAQRVYEAGQAPVGEELQVLGREGVSLGGILGGSIPLLGRGFSALKKSITPQIRETANRTIGLAKKYNIPLGLDDLTDDKFYNYLISEGQNLPFNAAGSSAENQLKSFTKAIAKTIGLEDVDRLTPTAMNDAFEKVGKQFDDLTKGKTFTITDDAMDGLSALEEAVGGGAYGEQGARLFGRYVDDLFSRVSDNAIEGDRLATLRNKLARISRTGTNIDAKSLAKDFENVLVDIIGEDAPEALRNAKFTYKNLIAVEPLARKAQVEGIISPAQLNNRVSQVFKRQHTIGKSGPLGELAEVGQAIKQRLPQSGTAPRQMIQELGQAGLALGAGYVNPLIPLGYFGGRAGQFLGNRLLQSRNVSPELIARLAGGKAQLPALAGSMPIRSGILSGQALGRIQQQ